MTDTQPPASTIAGDYSLILTIAEEWVHSEQRDTTNIYGAPTVVYDDVLHTRVEHFFLCVVELPKYECMQDMWDEMDDIPF